MLRFHLMFGKPAIKGINSEQWSGGDIGHAFWQFRLTIIRNPLLQLYFQRHIEVKARMDDPGQMVLFIHQATADGFLWNALKNIDIQPFPYKSFCFCKVLITNDLYGASPLNRKMNEFDWQSYWYRIAISCKLALGCNGLIFSNQKYLTNHPQSG